MGETGRRNKVCIVSAQWAPREEDEERARKSCVANEDGSDIAPFKYRVKKESISRRVGASLELLVHSLMTLVSRPPGNTHAVNVAGPDTIHANVTRRSIISRRKAAGTVESGRVFSLPVCRSTTTDGF